MTDKLPDNMPYLDRGKGLMLMAEKINEIIVTVNNISERLESIERKRRVDNGLF